MAQRIETRLVDDLDGSTAVETVRFAVEGREYEIDLSEENAARLRDGLAEFIAAARRAGGTRKAGAQRPAKRGSYDREHAVAVREWARANGFEVSERGRIPSAVVEAYDKREGAEESPSGNGAAGDVEVTAVPAEETPKKKRPSVTDPFAVGQAAS
ncbi:Lsr2 family protein [Pseudonocardia sp. S2-4]|uniref:Lsr2 family protein n=1 Tax=Pseudonocardia humida TaxID=2800819 RepID=A0ABT1A9U8_9PSEU|nr:Lsr2 family protein [Pseudonocardia humida]